MTAGRRLAARGERTQQFVEYRLAATGQCRLRGEDFGHRSSRSGDRMFLECVKRRFEVVLVHYASLTHMGRLIELLILDRGNRGEARQAAIL